MYSVLFRLATNKERKLYGQQIYLAFKDGLSVPCMAFVTNNLELKLCGFFKVSLQSRNISNILLGAVPLPADGRRPIGPIGRAGRRPCRRRPPAWRQCRRPEKEEEKTFF